MLNTIFFLLQDNVFSHTNMYFYGRQLTFIQDSPHFLITLHYFKSWEAKLSPNRLANIHDNSYHTEETEEKCKNLRGCSYLLLHFKILHSWIDNKIKAKLDLICDKVIEDDVK